MTLKNCVATVGHRGPMSALLWPLFVAACEAGEGRDRELAREAFEKVERRQGMRNIGRAWEVVGEVWRRVDEEEKGKEKDKEEGGKAKGKEEEREELWRTVCREMEVSLVFG